MYHTSLLNSKELLNQNRTELKVSMRSKWYKSNAPALQMALMKLIATPEELRKLSMQHSEIENNMTNNTFRQKYALRLENRFFQF